VPKPSSPREFEQLTQLISLKETVAPLGTHKSLKLPHPEHVHPTAQIFSNVSEFSASE
jgi:hypothetical protein